MTRQKPILAWHWVNEERMLRDGQPVEVGRVYALKRGVTPVVCMRGFHGSTWALDALRYAPGPIICLVRLSGTMHLASESAFDSDRHFDRYKIAASRRRVLWMADATRVLHECAVAWETVTHFITEVNGGTVDPRVSAALVNKRAWLNGEMAKAGADDALAAWASASAASVAFDAALSVARMTIKSAFGPRSLNGPDARAAAWAATNSYLETRLLALHPEGGAA